jgi:hypothetical protein
LILHDAAVMPSPAAPAQHLAAVVMTLSHETSYSAEDMRFPFEAEPRRCFERIGGRMPFGAHRWGRFDRAFYEPWLVQSGPGSEVPVRPPDRRVHPAGGRVSRLTSRLTKVAQS